MSLTISSLYFLPFSVSTPTSSLLILLSTSLHLFSSDSRIVFLSRLLYSAQTQLVTENTRLDTLPLRTKAEKHTRRFATLSQTEHHTTSRPRFLQPLLNARHSFFPYSLPIVASHSLDTALEHVNIRYRVLPPYPVVCTAHYYCRAALAIFCGTDHRCVWRVADAEYESEGNESRDSWVRQGERGEQGLWRQVRELWIGCIVSGSVLLEEKAGQRCWLAGRT
jgi:hypothetical protein